MEPHIFSSNVLLLFCWIGIVSAFYAQYPYREMYPAFGPYNENYNTHFINPYLLENNNEPEDEEKLFTSDEKGSIDEFEPVKRSEIRMPEFHGETAVKRDLIKGPSFQPNINEDDADSDLANENKEAIESLLAKRKDIFQPNNLDSDDEDIQGKDTLNDFLSSETLTESTANSITSDFLNGIQDDIKKVHDAVTRHVIRVDYSDDIPASSITQNNTSTDSNNNNNNNNNSDNNDNDNDNDDDKENKIVPSSTARTATTNKNNKYDTKESLQMTKRLIGLLFDFDSSSSAGKQGENKKVQKEKAINEYIDKKEDFDASDDFLDKIKTLNEPNILENRKTDLDLKKRKRKIDVTVNVNINEKAMKKSNVAVKPAKPNTVDATKRGQVLATKKQAPAKIYGKGSSSEEEEDSDDEDDEDEESVSEKETPSKTHLRKSTLKFNSPTLSPLLKPTQDTLKKSTSEENEDEDEDEDEDEEKEEEEDEEDSGNGAVNTSGGSAPLHSYAEKAKYALENIRHKEKSTRKDRTQRKLFNHRYHNPAATQSDSETAEAEEGEIAASNVKVNKLAASLEQKQNELEHNDQQAEPLSAFHSKVKKILNKEQAEEVRETTKKSTAEPKDLGHEAFIHNVKSGSSKAAKAEDVRIEQLSGSSTSEVNSQPAPEMPGVKAGADKKDETNEEILKKSPVSHKGSNAENVTDMTLEEVREKFKKWEHKVASTGVESAKQTESFGAADIASAIKQPEVEKETGEEKSKGQVEKSTASINDATSKLEANGNTETNGGKPLEEEEPSKKEKLTEDEDDAITKSANDAFTKVVNTITTPKDLQELHHHQDVDVKEVADSADKAFTHVVEDVMKGKSLKGDGVGHGHELKKLDSPSIGNLHLQDANLQKLKSFKAQILSEVEKINKLQSQYGKNSKGAKDLSDARSVLQKDLNVVKELEGRLKNRKNKNKEQSVVEHDQTTLGDITESKEETIPDARLGFTAYLKTNKKSHTKPSHKNKKSLHPLEEIHSLLKAEIKRLKMKKHGKPDSQLNNIRKLVQKRLKSFIKSGEIGKDEFKKLAPEIKELGSLLKHRIQNAKKIKGHHKEEDLMAEAKQMEKMKEFGNERKGVNSQLNKAEKALSNAPHPEDLVTAQSTLEKLQASNNSMVSSQSVKMKTLLTSLNTKLGQIFNKANTYQQQGTPQGYPQQSTAYAGTNPAAQPNQMHQIAGFQPGSAPVNIPNQFSPDNQHPQQQQHQQPIAQAPSQTTGLAKAETPEPDFEPDETKPIADDEPVDTLIEALERDITEVWSYRNMYPDADSLGLDNEKVHNAYANLGSLSGLSLRRALDRALRGEDVGLAVVGGSISKGGPFSEKGLDYVLKSYFYAIEDYWNKIIRPVTGSSLIVRDVSIGGISTDYYSYCLRNHLPDDKLTNIVLWELSANDMKRYEDSTDPKTEPLELFTRNVISYRAKPALIYVNFFANFDWDPELSGHCRNFEDEGEDTIAKYYKITSLSWRNMVCPEIQKGTSQIFTRDNLFAEDKFHPSIHGHAQVAYLAIDYIRTEFLKNLVKMRKTNIADAVTRLQIPHTTYVPRPLYPQTANWKPLCFTYMIVDDKMANNTLPLEAFPSGSFRQGVVREFKIRSDKIAGMNTLDKDQYLRFDIQLPPHPGGSIKPYKKLGIMSFTDDRIADVQFDAEPPVQVKTNKRFLEGTTIKYIAKDVRPGNHALSIRSGDNGFLVCAVVAA